MYIENLRNNYRQTPEYINTLGRAINTRDGRVGHKMVKIAQNETYLRLGKIRFNYILGNRGTNMFV